MYEFDQLINREDTNAYKLALCKKYFGTDDIVPLWVADMDFAAPVAVQKIIQDRARHEIYGYTIRDDKFIKAIQGWLTRQHHWQVDADHIEHTPGVLPAIVVAIHAFTEPEDKIIIQTPVYPPFYSIVSENGRELVKNSLQEREGYYTIDFEKLEDQAADPKTKMFILSNPHNPVGRAWDEGELKRIGEICLKHQVLIVSDEIHFDLCLFGNKHISLAQLMPELVGQIITCTAPSKTFNIAGMSTAYVVIEDSKLLKTFRKKLNALQMHMGNLFGGIALEAAYNFGDEWLKELKSYLEDNAILVKEFIEENMPEVGFVLPEATYLLWLDFREWGLSPSKLRKVMIEVAKVGMNDGVSFGTEGAGFQRLNIGSPKSVIHEALERILKLRNIIIK